MALSKTIAQGDVLHIGDVTISFTLSTRKGLKLDIDAPRDMLIVHEKTAPKAQLGEVEQPARA
ncbi:hypothetical protein [Salipiger sp.]|uniref:hypothetical protein n=1 Tax=Salipiger sp. TaxID=2078585 RepID=UPI003A987849